MILVKSIQCGLAGYGTNFDLMDYYHVDELAKMSREDLTGSDIGMTPGNAKFVLSAAREEVKQVQRVAKRARYEY